MNRIQHTRVIENIKSVILVVLFFTTILLLYLFWSDAPFQRFSGSDELSRREAVPYDEILRPSRVVVCFGGDSYAITARDESEPMIDFLRRFLSDNPVIDEITKEQYQDCLKFPSVRAEFDYYVPFSAFCEAFDIPRIAGTDGIDALSAFGYAEVFSDSVFIHDKRSDRYYRVVGGAPEGGSAALARIIGSSGGPVPYVTLETIFGGQIDNQTLIPASLESDLYDVNGTPEFESAKDASAERVARSFFSHNFDFVRKIEEQGGTTIYMYGFGKIVLIVDEGGTFEYKREEEDRSAAPVRYLDALGEALAFVADHGAFETLSGHAYTPHLTRVVTDPDGKRGYRFVFGVSINGRPLYYQNSAALTVDVIGGRVTYFKRDFIEYDEESATENAGEFREVFSAMNMLAYNLEHIGEIVHRENITAAGPGELTIEELAGLVDRLDYGYARPAADKAAVSAAWILMIGPLELYFGLDDGVLKGYSVK